MSEEIEGAKTDKNELEESEDFHIDYAISALPEKSW